MRQWRWISIGLVTLFLVVGGTVLYAPLTRAAYGHMGEADSPKFVAVYPDKAGTKLDSCSLCHRGGAMPSGGTPMNVGSCQWCHYSYGYDGRGDIVTTLNPYGKDYLANGRSAEAIRAIESLDSDGDGYTNLEEIAATRYPGDAADDPTRVAAPYRVFSREQLEAMPQYSEFLLMNASKSTDSYSEYAGVPLEDLIKGIALGSATGITVFSPDGFSTYHPLKPEPKLYQVYGNYPAGVYRYSPVADIALNPDGWVDYSSPAAAGRKDGDSIASTDGLKMLLALKRDGKYLITGVLDSTNKLNGEGPFRIVPPQLIPGPPDQRSTAKNQNVVWPYEDNADHNAGFSTRSATIIRVEPLPVGTTDINTLEAGWDYVDAGKIVVYGAIDPIPTVKAELAALLDELQATNAGSAKGANERTVLANQVVAVIQRVAQGNYAEAQATMTGEVLGRLGACGPAASQTGADWVAVCDAPKSLYWSAKEVATLLSLAVTP